MTESLVVSLRGLHFVNTASSVRKFHYPVTSVLLNLMLLEVKQKNVHLKERERERETSLAKEKAVNRMLYHVRTENPNLSSTNRNSQSVVCDCCHGRNLFPVKAAVQQLADCFILLKDKLFSLPIVKGHSLSSNCVFTLYGTHLSS